MPDRKITRTCLSTEEGIEVELLDFGATIKSLRVPVDGQLIDVVLEYPEDETYLENLVFLGSTVGRYAGRIASGRTVLNGKALKLVQNEEDTGHCLHGGSPGFSHRFWSIDHQDETSVCYKLVSSDGDQGFPGCLAASVTYSLSAPGTLKIEYSASSDRDTIINLSNHAYFNLNGVNSRIDNHELWMNADFFTPIADNKLPTGEISAVDGSVFDFRRPVRLGERLGVASKQLKMAGGYDHFFLLRKNDRKPDRAAILYSPTSGIRLTFLTDQPGVQLYTGNFLGKPFEPNAGLCLEFQDVPNEPNLEGFPCTVLRAGETYSRQITLEFDNV